MAVVGSVVLAAAPGRRSIHSRRWSTPFLDTLHTVKNIGSTRSLSNGDVNPYGIVNVPQSSVGQARQKASTLISNFNAKSNLQGTGTTIVQISRTGQEERLREAARSASRVPVQAGSGLTTALTILNGGYVVVGSLPVTDGGYGHSGGRDA